MADQYAGIIVNPVKEQQRLNATHRYINFSLNREKELKNITKLASQICKTPIALITLMDKDVQWIEANTGADLKQMPRNTSFCTHAIEQEHIMAVADASKDPRFSNAPVVVNEPHIRFYASANLKSYDNYNVGTLCVYDVEPKSLTEEQAEALSSLADQVSHIMELDRALKVIKAQKASLEEIARIQSHEIRLPVSNIMGVMELIKDSGFESTPPEYLHMMEAAVNHLDEKIRTIVHHTSSG